MVIGCLAGTRSSVTAPLAAFCSTPTLTLANDGMYFERGSSSRSFPSSTSIIAATVVIGFDIE
jgi:hypothetical protein